MPESRAPRLDTAQPAAAPGRPGRGAMEAARWVWISTVVGLLAGPVLVAGCHGSSTGGGAAPVQAGDLVVARVEGVPITAADVAAQMAGDPRVDRRRALEDRIVFEMLAREAARVALPPPTSDERAAVIAAEAQRLIERDLEPRLLPSAITDGDVRSLYERGRPRFVHGRLIQAAVAHVFTGARMKPEPRARAEQNAQLLRAELDQRPPRTAADLEALAREPIWADRGVGVTTVWQDIEADQPFPPVVARALAELKGPGSLTPLVGDETGYYVALSLGESPPENLSFAQVAPGLRAEMYEPWRRRRFMQLAMELTAGHDIEVFPDQLIPPASPARE